MDIRIEFNPANHTYKLNDQPVAGVTTVLGSAIDKSGPLCGWTAKTTVGYIDNNLRFDDGKTYVGDLELNAKNASAIFGAAKKEHKRQVEEAGNIGTQAHDIVQRVNKGESLVQKELADLDRRVMLAVSAYMEWKDEVGFKPLQAELRVGSLEWMCAGTLDILGEIDGVLTLADIKTGNNVYPEMLIQVCAYKKMYEEMTGKEIDRMMIIRLDKETGEFHEPVEIPMEDYPKHIEAFDACLKIHRWKKFSKTKV